MKKNLNESSYTGFTDTAVEVFTNTLNSMFEPDVSVSLSEAYSGEADDIMENFEDQTAIIITEENSGFDAGLFFKTQDITYLANLMMMMDEDGKDELEEEDKDAIKELSAQMLAALTVPIEEKFGKKVAFKVDDIMKNENAALFQSDEYFAADLALSVGDKASSFRFFMDAELLTLFEGGEDDDLGEPDFGQTFQFPDDEDDGGGLDFGGGGGSESPNLDMLKDIDIPISVKMGSTKMFLKDILSMGPGNIIELDESADEPVELVVNNKIIARGEVVIVDGYFGFRIKEIVSRAERLQKLKD